MKQKAIVMNPKDNVATALVNLKAGDTLLELTVTGGTPAAKLTTDIPSGHKFSLCKIETGSPVIKYGEVIGMSTIPIEPGDYVHTHNGVSARARGDLWGGAK